MGDDTWDLVVIGTGGAAMAAGIEARSRGKQVLLVEHGALGGTCLNIGCVPSKHLLAAAGQRHRARSGTAFPMVATSGGEVDLPALMAQKQDLIDSLRQAKYADAHGFPIRYGSARFTDERTLEVDGQSVVGAAYVVATGAAPHVPDLPGLDQVDKLTSTTAMEQQSLPASLVVVGAGPVGLEQAQLWAHLGSEVAVVGRFAPHAEPEIADLLRGVFADDGIQVVPERAAAVEPVAGGVRLRTASGQEVTGERLLVATGRWADTGDLGLAAAGIDTDERGFVVVDASQRTTNPRVFAAGNVSGAPQVPSVRGTPGEYPSGMVMHAWSEHVVHVELVSDDGEIARTAARFLELRFRVEDVEVHAEPGRVRVHSERERRVSSADVARALVEAGVRAHALHEREEWSVADA